MPYRPHRLEPNYPGPGSRQDAFTGAAGGCRGVVHRCGAREPADAESLHERNLLDSLIERAM